MGTWGGFTWKFYQLDRLLHLVSFECCMNGRLYLLHCVTLFVVFLYRLSEITKNVIWWARPTRHGPSLVMPLCVSPQFKLGSYISSLMDTTIPYNSHMKATYKLWSSCSVLKIIRSYVYVIKWIQVQLFPNCTRIHVIAYQSYTSRLLTLRCAKQASKPCLKWVSWTVSLLLATKPMAVGIRSETRQWNVIQV